MTARSWRKASIAALLVTVAALLVPSAARAAAPTVVRVEAFGNSPTDLASTSYDDRLRLYATAQPLGGPYEKGLLYVVGQVNDAAVPSTNPLSLFVDITVSEPGGGAVSRTVVAESADNPDMGRSRGDFSAELRVTNLGVHEVATNGGITPLTVTAQARAFDGTRSAPATAATVEKHAGTPGDTFAPAISRAQWPPTHWCHLSGEGVRNVSGVGPNGTGQGGCASVGSVNGIPDVSWLACVRETSQLPDNVRQLLADTYRANGGTTIPQTSLNPGQPSFWSNPARSSYCRTTESRSVPRGDAAVSGEVFDDATGSFGIGSEIGRIEVRVYQGATLLRTVRDAATRFGPRADYNVLMRINDFEPNYPSGDKYRIEVTAYDAWGNSSTIKSPEFTVYPW